MSYQTLTFTPDGSGNFYSVCREDAADFPSDPSNETILWLSDDSYAQADLSQGAEVSLYGVSYSSFYVGSNGYITFDSGDDSIAGALSDHFRMPRISALSGDLDPDWLNVSWTESDDRAVVTYRDIQGYFDGGLNSFQIEMFFNGVIRITYLEISLNYCVAGLSGGNGLPQGFFESDLDSYALCNPPNRLFIDLPEKVAEADDVLADQGKISLENPSDWHLIVELDSDDISEIVVPAAVLILAGEIFTTFDLSIIDDALSDGVETVKITASAEDCMSCSETIQVADKDAVAIPGDADYSGTVELEDAIRILKLLAGIKVRHVYHDSDVNGDGKIGQEEAMFVLIRLAE